MPPIPVNIEVTVVNGDPPVNGSGYEKKCPALNREISYPPVAPIPAVRRKTRGKSPMRQNSFSKSHSLESPHDFIRPDLPSRCTWSPTADKNKSPHTQDQS